MIYSLQGYGRTKKLSDASVLSDSNSETIAEVDEVDEVGEDNAKQLSRPLSRSTS